MKIPEGSWVRHRVFAGVRQMWHLIPVQLIVSQNGSYNTLENEIKLICGEEKGVTLDGKGQYKARINARWMRTVTFIHFVRTYQPNQVKLLWLMLELEGSPPSSRIMTIRCYRVSISWTFSCSVFFGLNCPVHGGFLQEAPASGRWGGVNSKPWL